MSLKKSGALRSVYTIKRIHYDAYLNISYCKNLKKVKNTNFVSNDLHGHRSEKSTQSMPHFFFKAHALSLDKEYYYYSAVCYIDYSIGAN